VYIKIDKAMVKVLLHQICYVESLKNYIRIKTVEKDLISYHTLGFMEDKLPQRLFRRVHKSFIVNLGKIESFTSEYVAVSTAAASTAAASTGAVARKEIPLGGLYKERILEILRDRSI